MRIITLIFLITLLFVGCGNDSGSDKESSNGVETNDSEGAGGVDDSNSEPGNAGEETKLRYKKSDELAEKVESDLVSANSNFAVKLFKSLLKDDEGKNLFISPISISTALSMTMNGAVDDTLDGMQKTLEMTGMTQEQINTQFLNLLQSLEYTDEDVLLTLANSIWLDPGYRENIAESFIEDVQTWYLSDVYDATTPEALNSWIEEKTGGKIKDMIDEFPEDLVMYLVNAIYFKGAWSTTFEKENTYSADFTKVDEAKVKVDMMSFPERDEYDAWQGDKVVGIRLPYGRGKISFYAFAADPYEGESIDNFIEKLDGKKLIEIIDNFGKLELGGIHLPKFKIEYKKELGAILKKFGMEQAFKGGFDKMLAPEKTGNPQISRVLHKSFIEVNEEGTEAAAATVVEVVDECMPLEFRANKPFLFLIRDDRNGTILFMGKVADPAE